MNEGRHENPTYRIRVTGHLDPGWAGWFEGLTITHREDGDSVLEGPVADQSALHGLLAKIRDLGLVLVSVNRLDQSRKESDNES